MLDQNSQIDEAIKELENKATAQAVVFIFYILSEFSYYCKEKNLPSTTSILVEHLPELIVRATGFLADLYLNKVKLISYNQIGLILDTLVSHKVFTYSPLDSIVHFNIDKDLIKDINTKLLDFSTTFETTYKQRIQSHYANTRRT